MFKTNKVPNFSSTLTGDVIGTIPEENYAIAEWAGTRQGRIVAKRTQMDMGTLHCRTALTATALEQVGKLTLAEGMLNQVAPWGADRYRSIVNAYTMRAVEQITKF